MIILWMISIYLFNKVLYDELGVFFFDKKNSVIFFIIFTIYITIIFTIFNIYIIDIDANIYYKTLCSTGLAYVNKQRAQIDQKRNHLLESKQKLVYNNYDSLIRFSNFSKDLINDVSLFVFQSSKKKDLILFEIY